MIFSFISLSECIVALNINYNNITVINNRLLFIIVFIVN